MFSRKGRAAGSLILALDARGVQPRDWPAELIGKLRAHPNRVFRSSFLALELEFAQGDAERVGEALERALAESNQLRPSIRLAFFAAAASFHGFLRGDAARVEAWLEDARKVKGAVSQKDWDSKARAAILYARGQASEANTFLGRYLALVDRLPASGMVAAERERTVELMERMKQTELAI